MDDLRFILLLAGIVVVLAVYAWTRYQRRPRTRKTMRVPSIDGQQAAEPDAEEIDQELARMGRLMAEADTLQEEPRASVDDSELTVADSSSSVSSPQPVAIAQEQLLIISVMAGSDRSFEGGLLRAAFAHNGLEYHKQGIFQRLVDCDERRRPVFGVANIVQPGVFDSADLEGLSTPGITLYLQLPAPVDALEAFDDFVTTSERLAVELGGELRDEQQNILSHQALMQIREGISEASVHVTS